jgi:predicted nucleic acid-binding protein
VPTFTLDTGALIALERGEKRMRIVMLSAHAAGTPVTVPAVVVSEWWRGRTKTRNKILASVDVERMTERLAKIAGEAVAAIAGSTVVDAIVMASAAQRGDVVFTSDLDDLLRLQTHFPSVRVLRA